MSSKDSIPPSRRQSFDGASKSYDALWKRISKKPGTTIEVDLVEYASPAESKGLKNPNIETQRATRTRVRARLRASLVYRAKRDSIDPSRIYCAQADRQRPNAVSVALRS